MERTQLFDLMGELRLYGMKAAFDDIMATAVKRQHEPQRVVGDLLTAEVNEKQARSIKYQLTIAKLPLAKDLDDFQFEGTPINQTLVNDLAGGACFNDARVEIRGKDKCRVAIDGRVVFDRGLQPDPPRRGGIALSAYTGGLGQCTVYYANVVVSGLAVEQSAKPRPGGDE